MRIGLGSGDPVSECLPAFDVFAICELGQFAIQHVQVIEQLGLGHAPELIQGVIRPAYEKTTSA
ncbi:hypothetical protein PSPTOT1_1072 [Pseudomonas syringae pv. tomato T1]|nr:hypothetical protein PSPTOT1_1072 [Pseudomonas syringae pv. tomato T1]